MVFSKIKGKLTKSRENISHKIGSALKMHPKLDEGLWEELEEILISADTGVESALEIVEETKSRAIRDKVSPEEVKNILTEVVAQRVKTKESKVLKSSKQIILVVGVNGVGKTTSIAKLARLAAAKSEKIILAAGDTFRAAAIEQLTLWAERLKLTVISHQRGGDAAAVVYDAIAAAKARGADYVISDTAGRLHTQSNLMEELKKVKRITDKESGDFEVVTLLVLDANTGQNALAQAVTFNESLKIDEIMLSKMDSTAKGGILVSIAKETGIPVGYLGLGEGVDDIAVFDPEEYAKALIQ
jgi:fused signal recognition particle receptor